jgi:hypothetical protein
MSGRFCYSVYGLAVDSNLKLPGLAEGRRGGVPLAVRGASARDFERPAVSHHFTSEVETLWHLDEERWLLRYDGRSMNAPPWYVLASEGGARLDVRWSEPTQVGDIASFLPGPALALALHMKSTFLLHAGAVDIGGRAGLIMGPSGAGKSTTIAALIRRGLPLISDDLAVVTDHQDRPAVHKGPRRLRLYAASARAAGWEGALPRLFRHPALDDKRYLVVPDGPAPDETSPIGAIFVLRPRDRAGSAIKVERLAASEALRPLLANLYCARFLDRRRAARTASRCAGLAARVPVFAVTVPDCLNTLPVLVDELLRAFGRTS